jgi:hypothetical protein
MDFLEEETDPTGIVFRDALFFMLLSLVVVIFLLTFLISPAAERTDQAPIRDEIVIEATWPTGSKYDIDLWGMGPDKRPVGWGVFSAGSIMNHERDDRGAVNDTSDLNYEVMTVRKREPGEYIINLHMYDTHKDPLPVPVLVKVVGKSGLGVIYSGQVLLERSKEELTVVRFTLDVDGSLLRNSVNNLQYSILSRR